MIPPAISVTRSAGAPPHIPSLDGFRGVCIALVLIPHTAHYWRESGALGVLLFFVLSGFLITSLLRREKARRARVSLRAFYVRRARRILPAALVFLAIVSVLAATG